MNAFEIYRDKLAELHRLTKLECEGHAAIIRDSEANDVRCAMERIWSDLSYGEQEIARDISRRLGFEDDSLCMVVSAVNEGDMLRLDVMNDDEYDTCLVGPQGLEYHLFELIGYDYFIKHDNYPLSQFKDHPRVKEYLKKR